MTKLNFFKQAPLKDDEGLGADRGDEVSAEQEQAALTDEEKKLATELKEKEEAEVAKVKAAAEKKAAGEEEEEGEDKEGKRKETRIPIARHKEILERERTEKDKALAKLAQYEGAEDLVKTNEELTKAENKLLELEGQYAKLLTDGKPEEAAKVMGEIRKLDRGINQKHLDLASAATEVRAYERARYDTTVERVEEAYPILNVDHDDYDAAKTSKVLTVAAAYRHGGMTPSAALQEAVKDLLGAPETKKQENAVETKARVTEAEAAKAKREEAARKKAADASSQQPARLDKAGLDADKLGGKGLSGVDVMKLSFEDFSKLDETAKARMRGDVVEE